MLSRPAPLWHHSLVGLSAVATIVTSLAGSPRAAWALSDIPQIPGQQQTEEPDSSTAPEPTEDEKPDDDAADPGLTGIPDPDPLINKPGEDQTDADSAEPQKPPPEVIYDISKAPEPVRRMRELMIEAAASGDIERLRALMNPGPNQTQIQLGTDENDPVAKLKSLSGRPGRRRDPRHPDRHPVDRFRARRRRDAGRGLCLALLRREAAVASHSAGKGRTAAHRHRRRRRGDGGTWQLQLLPSRHFAGRAMEVLCRRRLSRDSLRSVNQLRSTDRIDSLLRRDVLTLGQRPTGWERQCPLPSCPTAR